MKERPILFSAPMVRALLDGSKTQTRRPVKGIALSWIDSGLTPEFVVSPENSICPYGYARDRLWVRESFWGCDLPGYGDQPCVVYDDEWVGKDYKPSEERPWGRKFGRIPSIHMPRDCSRILLEVVSVRVERLNDCSKADAIAEGIHRYEHFWRDCEYPLPDMAYEPVKDSVTRYSCPVQAYQALWESINGAASWAANPWVWCIEFKRVTP